MRISTRRFARLRSIALGRDRATAAGNGACFARLTAACVLLSSSLFAAAALRADNPPSQSFDLIGPQIEMTVHRGAKTLPIARVPNLQPGDRLWVHPVFPADQSAHYLLIVAFLQGPTNPPPENWFTRLETWNKQMRDEGAVVTVPQNAQQALLFLAPETGGDFTTLRNAVRGRPGVFVRASQDLDQASLDRTRIEKYLAELRDASAFDPAALHERTQLLAQTLHVKVDQQCFERPAEQQATCLAQGTEQMILDDGHSESTVAALTSGPSSDLIGAISVTPAMGGGYFSPYVGAIVDMGRLFGKLYTAEYQYLPALALPQDEQLNLRLNAPPSFRNPKSVLVIGLPAVQAAQLPPLRLPDAKSTFCLQKTELVLPVEGAPLVFSTTLAHDMVLRVQNKSGETIDLPAVADPARGGFAIDTQKLGAPATLNPELTGSLHGFWGFDIFDGPVFQFRSAHSAEWAVPTSDQGALIAGRQDTLHVDSDCAVCVEKISAERSAAQGASEQKDLLATWKAIKPDELEITIPLKDDQTGPVKVAIKQYGIDSPDVLSLNAYSEAAHLERFNINSGDQQGFLVGTRLDEVGSVELAGVRFLPGKLSRAHQEDRLGVVAPSPGATASLEPTDNLTAHVALKDGRVLDLQTSVAPPRPKVTLVNKTVQPGATPSAIRLGNQDELPQDGKLSFYLKTEVPDKFPRTEKIEVATTDGSFDTTLSVADGDLVLEDAQSALAILDPVKNLGPSAFGPLQFRPVDADGTQGDWQPLAELVRIPSLQEVRCPSAPDKQCTLTGSSLFLLDSVASDAEFKSGVPVPVGYAGSTLRVPRPNGTLLYVKLRDDPSTVDMAALPVLPEDR